MNKLFRLAENGTTVGTEVRAGLTTFCAMAYIIFLNPVFLSQTGMDASGTLVATCLSAALACLMCAFFANKPIAMAAGMGLNTFFTYTLCMGGYSWQQALALTFIAGLVFLAVCLSPLHKYIIRSFPDNLKHAITAGIGLFIALVGLLSAGMVDLSTGYPALGDLSSPAVIIALIGVVITAVLLIFKVRGGLILGMLATVVISMICGVTSLPTAIIGTPAAISNVALKLDFHGLISAHGSLFSFIALLLSMTIVDMFDTTGSLIGINAATGMFTERDLRRVMITDASATAFGALCGCSTVTTFAESTTGIAAGAKTGLTTFVVGICFLLAMFFSPLASVITEAATAPALIVVGMYMFSDVRNVRFTDPDDSIPAFLTVVGMPFFYSITSGIAIGFISHVICKLAARKWKELNVTVIVLAVIFILYFIFS